MTSDTLLEYTMLINQTAIHSLPAVINSMNNALLRATTGDPQRTISLTRHPLPLLQNERKQQVAQETGVQAQTDIHACLPNACHCRAFPIVVMHMQQTCYTIK